MAIYALQYMFACDRAPHACHERYGSAIYVGIDRVQRYICKFSPQFDFCSHLYTLFVGQYSLSPFSRHFSTASFAHVFCHPFMQIIITAQ